MCLQMRKAICPESCSLPQKCHISADLLQVVHSRPIKSDCVALSSQFTVLSFNFSDCNGFHDPAVVLVTLGPDNCDTFPLHGFVFPFLEVRYG